MIDVLSVIGTAVSVIAAIFSFIQATKSKKEKSESQKIKEYIIEKYANYNDSQLRIEIVHVLKDLSKIRKKPFEQNPLTTGRKIFDDISQLLIKIQSQKIYETEVITNSVNACNLIITNLDKTTFSEQMSDLIGHLSDIARHIDNSIRSV
ncbi:MAG: hypothetical protein GX220_04550 [Treponema sp.]|nr:hypothetical protein [Treponema sp.]